MAQSDPSIPYAFQKSGGATKNRYDANGKTERARSILDDYATRYEHLLHQQRNLYESCNSPSSPARIKNSDSATRIYSDTTPASLKASAILSSHAAMEGMLRCALDAARKSPTVDGDTVESISCLLEETLYVQNYGYDDDNFSGHTNIIGDVLTEAALELEKKNVMQSQVPTEEGDLNLEEDGFDSDAEVDAFFEEYPECKIEKPIMNYFQVEQDEGDDGGDNCGNQTNKFPKRAERTTPIADSSIVTNNHDTSNGIRFNVNNAQSNGGNVGRVNNPYRNNRQATAMISSNRSQSAQSWDAYDAMNAERNDTSGINIQNTHMVGSNYNRTGNDNERVQEQNPFRTAREFKSMGGDDKVDGRYDNNDTQFSYGESQLRYPQHNSPFGSNDEEEPIYNPNRPNLSAGLKRKFQRPKIGSNSNGNISNKTAPSSGNGRSRSIGAGSNTNGQSSRPSNNSKNDDDEEELPEELKGLDKELVAKIENEIVDSGDSITFDDIAGLKQAKQTVMELVCWPMKRPDLFTGLRRGPNGLLLFGPPGTGKTLIGKAIAHESGATFFSISSSSLTSKWIGEGEKLVRTLFAVAAYREPAVVFIDEIDSLLTQRKADENEASRRIKTEFLVQLDGTGTSGQGRVLAIGATNRPHELDDAARRRFVKRLYIPLPEASDRQVLLTTLLLKNKHCLSDKEITKLSNDTKGFSGADLKALCTDAALGPIRQLGIHALEIAAKDVPPIAYKHFRHALRGMNPSVAKSDLDIYMEFDRTYGSKSVSADAYDGMSDDDSE